MFTIVAIMFPICAVTAGIEYCIKFAEYVQRRKAAGYIRNRKLRGVL